MSEKPTTTKSDPTAPPAESPATPATASSSVATRAPSTVESWDSEIGWMGFNDPQRAYQAAKIAIYSKMVPRCFETPEQVLMAVQVGAEAGLTPMVSVRSIYVVNGAPSWTTEAARALIRRGLYDPFTKTIQPVLMDGTDIEQGVWHSHESRGDKKQCTDECHGYCATYPRSLDGQRVLFQFSVGEAKGAGLWGKSGPWQQYWPRMLMHRACGFHFSDNYSGVMMGITTREALEDFPPSAFVRHDAKQYEQMKPPGVDPLIAEGAVEEDSKAERAGTEPDVPEPGPEGQGASGADGSGELPARSFGLDGGDS